MHILTHLCHLTQVYLPTSTPHLHFHAFCPQNSAHPRVNHTWSPHFCLHLPNLPPQTLVLYSRSLHS
jgi:hypothetical protein